jgi:hypothetical protein
MPIDHAAERLLYLKDWGVDITHLAVQQTYDPLTQSVVESMTETALMAIAGPLDAATARGTAGQHRREQRVFLVEMSAILRRTVRRGRHGAIGNRRPAGGHGSQVDVGFVSGWE